MNKAETVQVITLLAGNYDSIAKKDATQKQLMIKMIKKQMIKLKRKIIKNLNKKIL